MRVGILGGGLQGSCIAIALAKRNVDVTIFDRNERLLTRAAVANEGKVHLGYMYAGDPSLRTARAMIHGALSFSPFLLNYLDLAPERFVFSTPATYVVHRESQKSVDEVEAYLKAVHRLILEHTGSAGAYFGRDLSEPIRRWTPGELQTHFSDEHILAAFSSPEIAINPVVLADAIRAKIDSLPNIDVLTNHNVTAVKEENTMTVESTTEGVVARHSFDHVVNALWDGRIAMDASRGYRPGRPWIHRLKYGVDISGVSDRHPIVSITIVMGPFGEIVNYSNGSVYLTWYPSCLRGRTGDVLPPHWPIHPQEPLRSEILWGTYEALSAIHPALAEVDNELVDRSVVRGGPIVAWGQTDIDDPQSELHRRFEIGVTSMGKYHSVDPGKLTAAPYFAEQCAEAIAGPLPTGRTPPFMSKITHEMNG